MLPPGQKAKANFPRFGLPTYVNRFPTVLTDLSISLEIDGDNVRQFNLASSDLPRTTMQADFHCVTTWSYTDVTWAGIKFADFYKQVIRPLASIDKPIAGVVLSAQDGYRTSLPLADLIASNVLLADTLDGEPLTIAHAAPLRLVAPNHYGYKSLKHLKKIEFYSELPVIKRGIRAFLDHPRARVDKEERGRWLPGWILRYVYRPLIASTEKSFRTALEKHQQMKP